MGTVASVGDGQCCGCGTFTVQANSRLARLAAARAAGDFAAAEQALQLVAQAKATVKAGGIKTAINKNVKEWSQAAHAFDEVPEEEAARRARDRLLDACREGHFKRAVEAIASGADVHCQNLRGLSPLMLAAGASGKGGLDVIRFLLEALGDMEAKDEEGWTPLLHASRNNEVEKVHLLLERKASLKARSKEGKICTMMAALDSADSLVIDLITRQAAIDKKDDNGWSILFYATDGGRADLVKWLLKNKVNPREKAKDGQTPLMLAANIGNKKIGDRLVKKSANLDAAANDGSTALMVALRGRHEEFADWLIDCGCNVMARNAAEEDAVDIATNMGLNALRGTLQLRARIALEAKMGIEETEGI